MPTPLAVGLITLAALLIILIGLRRFISGGDVLDERLQAFIDLPQLTGQQQSTQDRRWVRQFRVRLNIALSGLSSQELARQLMSANWPITPIEYTLSRILVTAIGFLLGWLIASTPLGGVGFAIIIYILPSIALRSSINRRRMKFSKQLIDVLMLMTGAVRAGFSILQAIEVVAKEMAAPTSEEFHRVISEVRFGRPINQALVDLSERMDNQDLSLLVTALNIHYHVGGNLAFMMNSVAETVRDRIRLFGEVRVITTQQRMTSYVLSLLPFFVFGIMFIINPDYMMLLFDPSIICIPIGALTGIVLGFFIVQRMARIDI